MAVQLALLLLGPSHFKYEWKGLFVFGLVLIGLGGFIVLDAADQTSYFVIDALGALLLGAGIFEFIQSVRATWNPTTPFKLCRAVTIIVVGGIIVLDPVTMMHLDALFMGTAFIILGIFKLFFALVSRYPHWKVITLVGVMNVALGLLFFAQWGNNKHWIVPLIFGCMFIMMGIGAVSNARMLKNMRALAEGQGEEIGGLDYFLKYHVTERYKPAFHRLPAPSELPEEIRAEIKRKVDDKEELLVRVWMPLECAENEISPEAKIPLLSRYVLVMDKKGCLTVGHSSLQMGKDLYISHTDSKWYQKVKNAEEDTPESLRFLEQMRTHDQEGVFFESYEEESKYWMPATRTIKISKFNRKYLRLFAKYYKMDPTYNLSFRNCSTCVAIALDMALFGCLGGRSMTFRFLKLIFDKDLWTAFFIRKRADDMAWSPGLLHDYAISMNRLIEKHSTPGRAA